ncbi:TlpA family protein disulfide reductase [Parapedobacter tibetensis]|uniref:TlpA family protein disulfide reductase n=1 Tax=Parapedobacter tibetensis TaxID=2972951 RepID=UPI00214D94B1|nr:TlpA disulfide reductase family protein [Parapedobacter tibetensis]
MKNINYAILVLLSCFTLSVVAQEQNALMEQLKHMSKESDPEKAGVLMNKIIAENNLDAVKDAGTMDMLNGTVAIAFLRKRRYDEFKKYIGEIQSRFNQTSYMNMGATILLNDSIDTKIAERIALETLDLYYSYKDDPAARPAETSAADWNRFMNFAQYPYYDTYATALFANGKMKQALSYQEKSFDGPPEDGLPSAIARYARLLTLNRQEEKAYDLLLAMVRRGKSTANMNAQLKDLYVHKHGSIAGFDERFNEWQQGVQSTLKEELRASMLDTVAPGFSLFDLNGNNVSLSDYRGKVVVIDFWATWCVPCLASFPAMQKMVEGHPEVVFLFIATMEKQEGALQRVKSFMEDKKYPFHVLMDEQIPGKPGKYEVVSAYKPNGIPAKAVIDGKGRLRFFNTGFSTDSELINELEAMIELAKLPPSM